MSPSGSNLDSSTSVGIESLARYSSISSKKTSFLSSKVREEMEESDKRGSEDGVELGKESKTASSLFSTHNSQISFANNSVRIFSSSTGVISTTESFSSVEFFPDSLWIGTRLSTLDFRNSA